MSQILSAGAWQGERSRMGDYDSSAFCAKCLKECSGEVLRVENHHFHAECFVCRACGRSLASLGYYIKDGQFYCYDDFHHFFGSKCFSCGQFVEGEVITVMGSTFHVGCFKCGRCKKGFPPGEKVSFDGTMYLCQKCKVEKKKEADEKHTCAGCNDMIKGGQALLALDKQWHLWCFKCTKCLTLLAGEYMGRNGLPYCERDYQQEFGVQCAACKGYITGKVLQAGEKHYHPNCSRCAKCKRMFGEGEEMYLQDSEIWHPDCNNPTSSEPNLDEQPYIERDIKDRESYGPEIQADSYRLNHTPQKSISPQSLQDKPREPSSVYGSDSFNSRGSLSPTERDYRSYNSMPRNYKTRDYPDAGYDSVPRSSGKRTPDQGYYDGGSSGRASRSPPVEEMTKLSVNGDESEPAFPAPPPPERNTSRVSDWKSRYSSSSYVERARPDNSSRPYSRPYQSMSSYDQYKPNHDSGYGGSRPGSIDSPGGERFTSTASVNIRSKGITDDYRTEPVIRRKEARDTQSAVKALHRKSMPAIAIDNEKLQIFTYEQLKTSNYRKPMGVDRTRLEAHLSPEEFMQVLRMSKSEFYRLPKWRQNELKKQFLLF